MSEDRKEILKMLKDGIISVDDAEKLINALKEGEDKINNETFRSKNTPLSALKETLSNIVPVISEGLSKIGPAISEAVSETTTSFHTDNYENLTDNGYEKIISNENKFDVLTGSEILIINKKSDGIFKSCNIKVQGIEGEKAIIEQGKENIKIYVKKNRIIIKCIEGDILIKLPLSIAELKTKISGGDILVDNIFGKLDLKTMGGDIKLNKIENEISATTMGGDIQLKNISGSFNAKTMGGNINIKLEKNWIGDSKATTMGGNIELSSYDTISAKIKASTMAGEIVSDSYFKEFKNNSSFVSHKKEYNIGVENNDSYIKLKTMGGNIKLRNI